jgi:hypothetical protein
MEGGQPTLCGQPVAGDRALIMAIIDRDAGARVIALRRAGSTITGHNPQTLSSRGKRTS